MFVILHVFDNNEYIYFYRYISCMRYVALVMVVCVSMGVPFASAAQLDAVILADEDVIRPSFQFLKIVYVQYPDGGEIAEMLQGAEHIISFTTNGSLDADSKVVGQINQSLKNVSSNAVATGVTISYQSTLHGSEKYAVIEYKMNVEPVITDYVVARSFEKSTVDANWRGISIDGPVIIQTAYGPFDVNSPRAALDVMVPEVSERLGNVTVLELPIIDAGGILELPLKEWHSLFDNTAIISDAKAYNYTGKYVVTHYTMGTCDIFRGLCGADSQDVVEEISLDKTYTIKTVGSDNDASIAFEGYVNTVMGARGQEVFHTSLRSLVKQEPDTGEFPATIMYGMAGMAVVGGVLLFAISSRKLKNDSLNGGQTGIDPAHLASRESSNSAASYKTNRGESHLITYRGSKTPI